MREAISKLIGAHVAARRFELDMTQDDVAKLAGVSRQALSEIERGEAAPRWETIYALAGVLRCEVFDLLPTARHARRLHELNGEVPR